MTFKKGFLYFALMLIVAVAIGVAVFLVLTKKASPLPAENREVVFSGSHTAGFEGYFSTLSYALQYDPTEFRVASSSNAVSAISITDTKSGKASTVSFFYNDGAGFGVQEFWDFKNYCADCGAVANGIVFAGGTGQQTFEDSKEKWIVFERRPWLITIHLTKPLEKLLPVIEQIHFSSKETKPVE